jgi:peptide/nickel transport system permease protein
LAKELLQFGSFLFFLSLISVGLVQLRTVDRAYQYADSGISEKSLADLQTSPGFWSEYYSFVKKAIGLEDSRTESGESVYIHISERFWPSVQLGIFATFFATLFAVLLSMESVDRPGFQWILDQISRWILSTPIFIFAIGLLILFFYYLEILPPGGYKPWDPRYLILPGVSLGIRIYARLQLYLSAEAQKEWESGLFLILKSRGLSRSTLVYKNLLWKQAPTLIILIVLDLGSVLAGAMVVEEIFFFPGIGRSLFYAIKAMDVELLQFLLVYSGILFYLLNRGSSIFREKITGLAELGGK